MFFVISFLFWITVDALDSSFDLKVYPLSQKINDVNQRIFYTDESILSTFKSYHFTKPVNNSKYGFSFPEIDCEVVDILCPQLIQIFHVNDRGTPRLMSLQDLEKDESLEIVDEAGYVGSWPGYCGTSDGILVEMYSEITKTFIYITSNDQLNEIRKNEDNLFYHPTKVIGYPFSIDEEASRKIRYPFNAIRPYENNVFNKLSITLRPILRVTNGDLSGHTVDIQGNQFLEGYIVDKVLNISLIDRQADTKLIQNSCGRMVLLFETHDDDNNAYRIRNIRNGGLGKNEDTVKGAGYVFTEESSAKRCLGETIPIFEFQNPENEGDYHYIGGNEKADLYESKNWKNRLLIGYSTWGTFVFAKR